MKILVAVLDWGLGHASRSTVVVRALLEQQHEVVLGGSGDSLQLLQKEFPHLLSVTLPAYNPQYPAVGSMVWKMLQQLPHFMKTIRNEHQVVHQHVQQLNIDCIISDNRYGCFHEKVKSIFITHQSNILMPKRFGWLSPAVRFVNERLMNHFDCCWIPDYPEGDSLAGVLVEFGNANKSRVKYIGALSRFSLSNNQSEKQFDLVCILSGPEPQRSIFEKLVTDALHDFTGKAMIVRGLFSDSDHEPLRTTHVVMNNMTGTMLQDVISKSEIVLARCGYSTVMDLYCMGAKAILVPTPGQTEQEYLAERLSKMRYIVTQTQNNFNLPLALEQSKKIIGFSAKQVDRSFLSRAISTLEMKKPKQ